MDRTEAAERVGSFGGVPAVLSYLIEAKSLDPDLAQACLIQILSGLWSPSQIGAFLAALRAKGETPEEILGFARAMREFAVRVELKEPERAIDTCGTGGDRAGTINVSTLAAFIAAAAGVPVAKHGNRAASSSVGSADLLEAMGARLELAPEKVAQAIESLNFGFMFAPAFHPALKAVAPIRRELGVPTVFNMLGPLANPAGVKRQVLGVPSREAAGKIAEVLSELDVLHALVVTGEGGLDEAAVTGPVFIKEVKSTTEGVTVEGFELEPLDLGFERAGLEELRGGDVARNLELAQEVLRGVPSARLNTVVLNAGLCLYVAGAASSIERGCSIANEVAGSGKAEEVAEAYVAFSNAV